VLNPSTVGWSIAARASGQVGQDRLPCQGQGRVIGPEGRGHPAGDRRLIEPGLVEPDADRPQPGPGDLGRDCGQDPRVDPPGQEQAQRDVGDQPEADRLPEPVRHLGDGRRPVGPRGLLRPREGPVPRPPDLTPAPVDDEGVPRREEFDPPDDGAVPEDRPLGQERLDGLPAHDRRDEGRAGRQEGPDLGRQQQPAGCRPEQVEGLDPERSRHNHATPRAGSSRHQANIPRNRSTAASPQARYPCRITSVSHRVRQGQPARASSGCRSR
jgi:hypothetical protein